MEGSQRILGWGSCKDNGNSGCGVHEWASSLKDKSHSCNKSSEDSATREGHVLKLAEMAANDDKQEDEESHLINKLFKQLRKEREVADEARALLEEMQKKSEASAT